jgi:hypothetical protein
MDAAGVQKAPNHPQPKRTPGGRDIQTHSVEVGNRQDTPRGYICGCKQRKFRWRAGPECTDHFPPGTGRFSTRLRGLHPHGLRHARNASATSRIVSATKPTRRLRRQRVPRVSGISRSVGGTRFDYLLSRSGIPPCTGTNSLLAPHRSLAKACVPAKSIQQPSQANTEQFTRTVARPASL